MKTKRLLTVLAIASVVFLAGCRKDDFVEVTGVCPLVISTDPSNAAINVPLNKVISVTFNVEMDPATFNETSFILQEVAAKKTSTESKIKSASGLQGLTSIAGTVSYAGKTATFTPDAELVVNTTYNATIKTLVRDLNGNPLQLDYAWSFSTGAIIVPTVISTVPLNGGLDVAFDQVVAATFSVPMDPATIDLNTFTLMEGLNVVNGAVGYSGSTATFTPDVDLLPNTEYTATITTLAANTEGVAIVNDYVWSFTTSSLLIAPTVINVVPVNRSINVPLNQLITAEFSEAMNPLSISATTFTVSDGVSAIFGAVTYVGTTATFTPSVDLVLGATYTATITTGASNVAGTPLANDFVWIFTTDASLAPIVILTNPLDLANGVALNQQITAEFSEAMNPLTITSSSFTLMLGATPVSGLVSYSGTTATFVPSSNLLSDNTYTATITTIAESALGAALATDYVWTFSTGTHLGPIAPNLLSVAAFGIIAYSTVTNDAGASEIHDMNVGLYPGLRSSVTGFFIVDGGPGLIFNGDFYGADDSGPMLLQAKNDLTAAYLFAEAATAPAPATVAGDIGGTTKYPGIYKSTSTLLIQSGDLTLDAQGDANAVWIFQIASDLTSVGAGSPFPSSSGGNVILVNGAQAKNVFWQVGASAYVGDYTSFQGNILALISITMNPYAQATGRMLTQTGAVTLTSTNIIYRP